MLDKYYYYTIPPSIFYFKPIQDKIQ